MAFLQDYPENSGAGIIDDVLGDASVNIRFTSGDYKNFFVRNVNDSEITAEDLPNLNLVGQEVRFEKVTDITPITPLIDIFTNR